MSKVIANSISNRVYADIKIDRVRVLLAFALGMLSITTVGLIAAPFFSYIVFSGLLTLPLALAVCGALPQFLSQHSMRDQRIISAVMVMTLPAVLSLRFIDQNLFSGEALKIAECGGVLLLGISLSLIQRRWVDQAKMMIATLALASVIFALPNISGMLLLFAGPILSVGFWFRSVRLREEKILIFAVLTIFFAACLIFEKAMGLYPSVELMRLSREILPPFTEDRTLVWLFQIFVLAQALQFYIWVFAIPGPMKAQQPVARSSAIPLALIGLLAAIFLGSSSLEWSEIRPIAFSIGLIPTLGMVLFMLRPKN